MDSASGAVLNQIIIMFIILIIGIICYKVKLINDEGKKQLSSLVMYVVNPLLIFLAYQTDFRVELIDGLIWTTIMAAVTYILFISASYLFFREKKGRDVAVERFMSIYSNCGFMGTPLIFGVFGSDGVFLQNGFITMFNLCVWTHGIMSIKGERSSAVKSIKKVLTTPAVISVILGMIMFFFQIRLPETVYTSLNNVAEMTTPLAMIVAGGSIAASNISKCFSNLRVYYVTFIRLFIFPAIGFLAIMFFPAPDMAKLITLIEIACPSATMGVMFAITFNRNVELSSQIFAVSTLLSMITLPLIAWCGTAVLGAITA